MMHCDTDTHTQPKGGRTRSNRDTQSTVAGGGGGGLCGGICPASFIAMFKQ